MSDVPIVQADREAAADYMSERDYDWGYCSDVREGRVEHALPRAFARHRRQSTDNLFEALRAARDELMRGDFDTGYCCCGDLVEGHSIGSGHAPVDAGSYSLHQTVVRIDTALNKAGAA